MFKNMKQTYVGAEVINKHCMDNLVTALTNYIHDCHTSDKKIFNKMKVFMF